MDNRIGVISIVVNNPELTATKINQYLSEYSDIIIGRMGIPYRQKKLSVIALIVDGTTDDIGALTGKLGNLPEVKVKSALSKK
ncbi:MAG: iron-only hydrogenase system regulator [Clostridia bacterium]|nr:iron-only hydrogenase system regulator [Clostridia bacterium]